MPTVRPTKDALKRGRVPTHARRAAQELLGHSTVATTEGYVGKDVAAASAEAARLFEDTKWPLKA